MNEEYGEESRTSVETSLEREKREKPVRENTFFKIATLRRFDEKKDRSHLKAFRISSLVAS